MCYVNKITKSCRCLRWSTICVIFYIFLVGLILHSVSNKLQNAVQSSHTHAIKHIDLQNVDHESTDRRNLPEVSRVRVPEATIYSKAHIDLSHNPTKTKAAANTLSSLANSIKEKPITVKAFEEADKNHDAALDVVEIADFIHKKIVDHIDEAINLNPREFRNVDISPADGLISWEEYYNFFLKAHGLKETDIDEEGRSKNRRAREDLARDKRRWSEAARTELFSLTIDEYLSFRHPESSITNLLGLVDDLLRQFDQDGDDLLTIEEFSNVNMNDDVELMQKTLISTTVPERNVEFKRIIDRNNDGTADRGELLHYINPKSPRYAFQEAANLLTLCDENRDGKITLKELEENSETILTSKMIDTATSFHNEF